MTVALLERLAAPGPKRILAIDGGGVRGIVALAFLQCVEDLLRARSGNAELCLADYFDLIGGTSIGAVIATALALGRDVATIRQQFGELVTAAFVGRRHWRIERARYDPAPLERVLLHVFGDRTLGDSEVRTGLCIVTKRADTGSTWPLLNHPAGQFYAENRRILLRDALRASAAAPTYFEPEQLRVLDDEVGVFVDGGVSMATNPAFQLFLVATLQGFHFNWSLGENRLLLVSVGTGSWRRQEVPQRVMNRRLWNWLIDIPGMLIHDGSLQNQLFLQLISRSPTAIEIDREIGDLSSDLLTPEPLLSYIRYDARLDAVGLQALDLSHLVRHHARLRELSSVSNLAQLELVGDRSARLQVKPEHFPLVFDPT